MYLLKPHLSAVRFQLIIDMAAIAVGEKIEYAARRKPD